MFKMSYHLLKKEVAMRSENDSEHMFEELDAAFQSFEDCCIEDRYAYAYLLKRFPKYIDSSRYISENLKKKFANIQNSQQLTIAKIIGYTLSDDIDEGRYNVYTNNNMYIDGPVVIFVIPENGNALRGNTAGLYYRHKKGAYPPTGVYHASSILNLLGITTYVFDLDLEDEYARMLRVVKNYKDRLYFVSISSRFMGAKEFDLAQNIRKDLKKIYENEIPPFILGGGIGPVSAKDEALRSGSLDGIICGISPFSLAEMVLDSQYGDLLHNCSDFHECFSDISNLAYFSKNSDCIVTTHIEMSCNDLRMLVFKNYNIAKISYETRYWAENRAIAICSPDDLNITIENKDNNYRINDDMHPANYLFKPHLARFLSVIGNCPRNCRFCHWHTFDHNRFIVPYGDLIRQLEDSKKYCPGLEMIGWLDEDFLIWKPDIEKFFELYKKSSLFPSVRQSLETLPQYITTELLQSLRNANFKGIYLGYESPVKRILNHMRKLHSNESYETFRRAPYMCYDAGFVTRCSTITFYPELTIDELYYTIDELVNMIDYGISIEINPYVVAVPGSEMSMAQEYEFKETIYQFANGYKTTLKEEIIPKDKLVANIAELAISNTQSQIEKILNEYGLNNIDHDMSFEVLGFFIAILEACDKFDDSKRTDDLCNKIGAVLKKLYKRHVNFLTLRQCTKNYTVNAQKNLQCAESLFANTSDHKDLWYCMQQFIDFGDVSEVFHALQLIADLHKIGYKNARIKKSEEILIHHPLYDISSSALVAYTAND